MKFCFSLIIIFFALSTYAKENAFILGKVVTKDKKGLRVRSCPSLKCTIASALNEGAEYLFDDKPIGDWLKIDNYYVHKGYIKVIKGSLQGSIYNNESRDYKKNESIQYFIQSLKEQKNINSIEIQSIEKHLFKNVPTYFISLKVNNQNLIANFTEYLEASVFSLKMNNIQYCKFGKLSKDWLTYSISNRPKNILKAYNVTGEEPKVLGLAQRLNPNPKNYRIHEEFICVEHPKTIIRYNSGGYKKVAKKYDGIFEVSGTRVLLEFKKSNLSSKNPQNPYIGTDVRNLFRILSKFEIKNENNHHIKKGRYLEIWGAEMGRQYYALSDLLLNNGLKIKKGEAVDSLYLDVLDKFHKKYSEKRKLGVDYGLVRNMKQLNYGDHSVFFNLANMKLGELFSYPKYVRSFHSYHSGDLHSENPFPDDKESLNVIKFIPSIETGVTATVDESYQDCQEYEQKVMKLYPFLEKYGFNKNNIKSINNRLNEDRASYNGALELLTKKDVKINNTVVPSGSIITLRHIVCNDFVDFYSVKFSGPTESKGLKIKKNDIAFYRKNKIFRINRAGKIIYSRKTIVPKSNLLSMKENESLKYKEQILKDTKIYYFCMLDNTLENPLSVDPCLNNDITPYGNIPERDNVYTFEVVNSHQIKVNIYDGKHYQVKSALYNTADIITTFTLVKGNEEHFMPKMPYIMRSGGWLKKVKDGDKVRPLNNGNEIILYNSFCRENHGAKEDLMIYRYRINFDEKEKFYFQMNYKITSSEICEGPGC